jgi:hypothetical protein
VDAPRSVYRFVHASTIDAPALTADFVSDREAGKPPLGRREKMYPELRDGMSTFGSLNAARGVWQSIREAAESRGQAIKAGHFVAEVLLTAGQGFDVEDLGEPDEHLTIWGAPDRLAAAVQAVYPASTSND